MKKLLALVLSAILVCSCIPALAEGALSGTIRYSTWGSVAEKEINEQIIAAFMAENPGCTVELEYIPDNYVQKIDTMFLGGDAPDVLYGHPHYFAGWAANDLLMNLNDMFEADHDFFYGDNFASDMYTQYCYKGNHVATVNGHDTFLLFYNKDMFDAAGVGYPTDDWTWDDFVAAGIKLTDTTSENKTYAIVMDEIQPIMYTFGGRYYDSMDNPTKVTIDSPETVAAFQFVQDCIKKHGIAPDTTDSNLLGGSFQTGRVAMQITGAWGVAVNQSCTFKWDVAQLPKVSKDAQHCTSAYYAGYAVNAGTQNPELAKAFAKYFQSETAQKILAGPGLITVIDKNIANSDEVLKGENAPEHAYLRVSTIDNAIGGYAMLTNLDEMQKKVRDPAFDQLRLGSITPEDCAKLMQEGMEALLPAGI